LNFLDSLFRSEKTYYATIQTRSQTSTAGNKGPIVWTDYKTVECIFYRGNLYDTTAGQKYKAEVAATILFRPYDISASEIPDNARVIITEGPEYCKVNNTGGYPAGTTTVLIDSLNDSRKPLKAGDSFTLESGS
jgi:hypothetical protein